MTDQSEREAFDFARETIVANLRQLWPEHHAPFMTGRELELDGQRQRIIRHIAGLRFKDLF